MFAQWRQHENKNDCIDSGAMLCSSGRMFRRQRRDGHLEAERGQIEARSWGPKNHTVVYEAAGDNVKVTVDGTGPDGKPKHEEWTGKFDGKDYPVTGDPNSDARSYKKIGARTLEMTVKKDGKVTATGRIVVSANGKTRTVAISGTNPQGKKFKSTALYDKQ